MVIKCLLYRHEFVAYFFTEIAAVPLMPLMVSVTHAIRLLL